MVIGPKIDKTKKGMCVFVKTLTEMGTLVLYVNENDSLLDIKKEVYEKWKIPANEQRYIFAGKQLEGILSS